jgi:hypothetical protein
MNFEGATPRVYILTGGRLPPPTDLNGLAEIGKPKPNWELQGILGLADFVLGFLVGKQFILMRDLLLIDELFRLSLFPPFPCMELGIIPVVIQIFPNLGDIGLQDCYIGLQDCYIGL